MSHDLPALRLLVDAKMPITSFERAALIEANLRALMDLSVIVRRAGG